MLHYTTFVEIMVPMFEMQFFVSKVVRTLEHAETGGLCCAVCLPCCMCVAAVLNAHVHVVYIFLNGFGVIDAPLRVFLQSWEHQDLNWFVTSWSLLQ